ncbi:MAG TPA: SDR family NAD(P)-dependent oxidoreductase [Acidimicrobiales bacterium]|nr:SDR family NAD(P)-dependent oxidoreductase [Acidimicrobiales bacterium]
MQLDLRGQVAIVTGAARGIGRTIAEAYVAEGMHTVVLDINADGLKTLADELAERGQSAAVQVVDVRSVEAVEQAVADTMERFGRIDVLVNNAGVAGGGPVDTLSEERWQHNIDVNLTGVFHMCRAVIPHMKRQHRGRIINASSFAAIVPSVGGAAYAASKAGVHYLTRVLAGELGPWDITVNAYAPGMVPTQMNHFADLPPERQETLLDMLTLRRWGERADIANLMVFLASDAASYITGTLVDVSGGKLAVQRPNAAYDHYDKTEANQETARG